MSFLEPNECNSCYNAYQQVSIGWLTTTGASIFLMQLGFLCFEAGYMKPIWINSVIFKNIEDQFIGFIIYIFIIDMFINTNSNISSIIPIPNKYILYNYNHLSYTNILISSTFATTCTTIISGTILDRIKNKVYIIWCSIILIFNYTFVSYWIWNKNGFLNILAFHDFAGSLVVHSLGATAGLIAIINVGTTRDSLDNNGKLKPLKPPNDIKTVVIGCFILLYGAFSFNICSPLIGNEPITPEVLSRISLITMIGISVASTSALIICKLRNTIELHDILSCSLVGLISVTGCADTVSVGGAVIISFIASPLYYITNYVIRYKLNLDDPLSIMGIHLVPGIYSTIMEGILGDNGLIYGNYKHFGVQLLGSLGIFAFNFVTMYILWKILLVKIIFKNTKINVTVLDTYLGTLIYKLDSLSVLNELISCRHSLARQYLLLFHKFCVERYTSEHLNFLVLTHVLNDLSTQLTTDLDDNERQSIQANIFNGLKCIKDTYIARDASDCINIGDYIRNITIMSLNKIINGSPINIHSRSSNILNKPYKSVEKLMVDVLKEFFDDFSEKQKSNKYKFIPHGCLVPFTIDKDWSITWDDNPVKMDTIPNLKTKIPSANAKTFNTSKYVFKATNYTDGINLTVTNVSDNSPGV